MPIICQIAIGLARIFPYVVVNHLGGQLSICGISEMPALARRLAAARGSNLPYVKREMVSSSKGADGKTVGPPHLLPSAEMMFWYTCASKRTRLFPLPTQPAWVVPWLFC